VRLRVLGLARRGRLRVLGLARRGRLRVLGLARRGRLRVLGLAGRGGLVLDLALGGLVLDLALGGLVLDLALGRLVLDLALGGLAGGRRLVLDLRGRLPSGLGSERDASQNQGESGDRPEGGRQRLAACGYRHGSSL
jgi:hypothetical protein